MRLTGKRLINEMIMNVREIIRQLRDIVNSQVGIFPLNFENVNENCQNSHVLKIFVADYFCVSVPVIDRIRSVSHPG